MSTSPMTFPTKKKGPKSRGYSEVVHASVTPELKAWLLAQPEDQSVIIRQLLEKEQARREQLALRRRGR